MEYEDIDIVDLIQQVNINRSKADLSRRIMKAAEELGELNEAFLSSTSESNSKEKSFYDIIEEACDLAIMGLDIALTKNQDNITDEHQMNIVKDTIYRKLVKWQRQKDTGQEIT